MTYSIIGSGKIGSALVARFAAAGIDVLVSNSRGPRSLDEMIAKFGAHVKPATVSEAARADVVFLAVHFASTPDAVRGVGPWSGRIVVDTTNAIDFPAFTPKDLGGRLSTDIIADLVPGARVVKAFNTLTAPVLAADPAQNGGTRVLFVSGNDTEANATVAKLAERLGFAPLVLGRIDEGGRLQHFGGTLPLQNLIKLDPAKVA